MPDFLASIIVNDQTGVYANLYAAAVFSIFTGILGFICRHFSSKYRFKSDLNKSLQALTTEINTNARSSSEIQAAPTARKIVLLFEQHVQNYHYMSNIVRNAQIDKLAQLIENEEVESKELIQVLSTLASTWPEAVKAMNNSRHHIKVR